MAPLARPLLALAAGILLSPCLDESAIWRALALSSLLALARPRFALLAIALLGAGLRSLEPPVPPDPGEAPVRLIGFLLKPPEWRGLGVYLDVAVESIDDYPSRGRARLTQFLNDSQIRELFTALQLERGNRVEVVVKLHRPAVYRNPGVFDFRRHLERQHIYWTGNIRNPRLIRVLDLPAARWRTRIWLAAQRRIDRIQDWSERRLRQFFGDHRATEGVVLGMVLGKKRTLPASVEKQFQRAGLYHLLVVSGFNLAIVAGTAMWVLRFIPLKRTTRFILVLASSLGYAAIVEGEAPVTRAALMVCFLVVGKMMDRGYSAVNALSGSAIIILLADPTAVEDASFQMTFAAVLAVVGIGVPAGQWILGWLRLALSEFNNAARDARLPSDIAEWRVLRRLWCEYYGLPHWTVTGPWKALQLTGELVVTSIAVQTVFVIFMVESFHRLTPISALLNLPAGLIAGIVTPAGLLILVLPDVLAFPAAWFIKGILALLFYMLEATMDVSVATVRVPSPPVWVWLVYVSVMALVWMSIHRHKWRIFLTGTCGLMGFQAFLALGDFEPSPPANTTLTFLDVGQGDSALVEFPSGWRMLIDGGGAAAGGFLGLRDESSFSIGEDVVSPYLFSRGIRRLDVVVLTHAHYDHLDGLLDIIENFQVGEVWLGRNPMIPAYRRLIETIQRLQIPIRWVFSGQTLNEIAVVHPPADWRTRKAVQNDDSVVLLLKSQGYTALLTGDVERPLPVPEKVDVLKVPHHGSKGSRLKVQSNVRIISVGAHNSFGHPHSSVLPALRTDQLGAITVTMAPEGPRVASALTNSCPPCKLTSLGGH